MKEKDQFLVERMETFFQLSVSKIWVHFPILCTIVVFTGTQDTLRGKLFILGSFLISLARFLHSKYNLGRTHRYKRYEIEHTVLSGILGLLYGISPVILGIDDHIQKVYIIIVSLGIQNTFTNISYTSRSISLALFMAITMGQIQMALYISDVVYQQIAILLVACFYAVICVKAIDIRLKIFLHNLTLVQENQEHIKEVSRRMEREKNLLKERESTIDRCNIASLSKLSLGLAHEVNNPLSIVMGFLRKLKNHSEQSDQLKKEDFIRFYDVGNKQLQKIAIIIDSLKTYCADESLVDHTEFYLAKLMDQIMVILNYRCQLANVEVDLDLQEDMMIFGNKISIMQSIIHVVNNAIDAVENNDGKKAIHIRVNSVNELCQIEVEDNGEGLLEENTEKIFNPFFTTRSKNEHSGQGLNVAKNHLMAHGGDVRLISRKDPTIFMLEFAKHSLNQRKAA